MAEIIPNTSDVRNAYINWIGTYNETSGLDVHDGAAGRAFDVWLNNVETVARTTGGVKND